MSKRLILGVLLAVVAVSTLLAVWLVWGREGATRAQGETVEMGIDPDVTGNTAGSLGTLEDCVRLDVPSPAFDNVSDYAIDVYVQGDTQAPMAYDAWVTYDATKVHIAAPGTSTLIKLPGASYLGDVLPDTDGMFIAGSVYLSGGPGIAGDGALVRLGLDIGGSGVVVFDFDSVSPATTYVSASSEHPITRGTAQLAINEDCPRGGEGAEPSPTPEGEGAGQPTLTPNQEGGGQATPTTGAATPRVTHGMLGCPDCGKAGDQLGVAAEDVQLGPDGKYYIPDRGDGCAYRQEGTGVWPDVILRAPGCEVFWTYDPATGQLRPTTP